MLRILLGLTLLASLLHGEPVKERLLKATFDLEYIKTEDALRALRPMFPEQQVRALDDGSALQITAPLRALGKARELLALIDVPSVTPVTLWVEIQHVDVQDLVPIAFLTVKLKNPNTFRAVPQPRTQRVFLMGDPEDMDAFAELLISFDRFMGSRAVPFG